MEELDFIFSPNTYEIINHELINNYRIVFHGTTTMHSEFIENNGFVRGYCPFNIDSARNLIRVLEQTGINADFYPNSIRLTHKGRINQYLINLNSVRTSFTPLSSATVPFSLGDSRGGQIFQGIRSAIAYLNELNDLETTSADLKSCITDFMVAEQNFIAQANNFLTDQGVVYGVELTNELINNIDIDYNNVVYSKANIPALNIIAKIIIPEDFNPELINPLQVKEHIYRKLYGTGGLKILVERLNNPYK
jgi:hypothetical protein